MCKITLKTLYRTKWCRKLCLVTLRNLINCDLSYDDYNKLPGIGAGEKAVLLKAKWLEEKVEAANGNNG